MLGYAIIRVSAAIFLGFLLCGTLNAWQRLASSKIIKPSPAPRNSDSEPRSGRGKVHCVVSARWKESEEGNVL